MAIKEVVVKTSIDIDFDLWDEREFVDLVFLEFGPGESRLRRKRELQHYLLHGNLEEFTAQVEKINRICEELS